MVSRYLPISEGYNLQRCVNLTDESILHINRLQNVKLLVLDYCSLITDKGLQLMTLICNSIDTLSLEAVSNVTDLGINYLASHCKRLVSINLNKCIQVSCAAVCSLIRSNRRLHTIKLQALSIEDVDLSKICSALAESGREYYKATGLGNPQQCTALTDLDISYCRGITDFGLVTVSETCPNLKFLNVSKLARVSDTGIKAVCSNCWYLEQLLVVDIFLVRAEAFWFDAKTDGRPAANELMLKKLVCLDLTDCVNLVDHGFRGLAERCRHLEELVLKGCDKLSDKTLVIMADDNVCPDSDIAMCHSLKSLVLANCSGFSGQGITTFVSHTSSLHTLDLSGLSTVVNDAFIRQLGQNCHTIQFLRLQKCILLSDAALCSMVECLWLEELDLTGCHRITDAGVEVFTEGCNGVVKLVLQRLHKLSDRTVRAIRRNCTSIQQLNMKECHLISEACLLDLQIALPTLKVQV